MVWLQRMLKQLENETEEMKVLISAQGQAIQQLEIEMHNGTDELKLWVSALQAESDAQGHEIAQLQVNVSEHHPMSKFTTIYVV